MCPKKLILTLCKQWQTVDANDRRVGEEVDEKEEKNQLTMEIHSFNRFSSPPPVPVSTAFGLIGGSVRKV